MRDWSVMEQYRQDYDALGLDDRAGWDAACAAYRDGLQRWDPERFATRPRERLHAEQRLVQLVQGFHRLRSHYKEHGRLPLEPTLRGRATNGVTAIGDMLGRSQPGRAKRRRMSKSESKRTTAAERTERPRTDSAHQALPEKKRHRVAGWRERLANLPWYVVTGAALLATLAFVLSLDMSARRALETEQIRARTQRAAQSEPAAPDEDAPSGGATALDEKADR